MMINDVILVAYILACVAYGYFALSRKCETVRFNFYKAMLDSYKEIY